MRDWPANGEPPTPSDCTDVAPYDPAFAAAQLGAADLVSAAYVQGVIDAEAWHAAVALRMREHREAVAEREAAAAARRRTAARVRLVGMAAGWTLGWILGGAR